MVADLELILQMQGLDARAVELRKEIALLPKQIAEIEKALVAHARKLDADRALLAGNLKERKQAELEIQTQKAAMAKLKDQMTSAKTNEQFKAFQNEIDFCETAIKKHEDRIVVLMELAEPLQVNFKAAEAALLQEKKVVEARAAEARERTAQDQKELAEITEKRQAIAVNVSKPVLLVFERLSKKAAGNAITDATKGRCLNCHLELRPQLFQDLRKGGKLFTCENCGRILHYNPPVAFDKDAGGPVPFNAAGTRVDMS